MLFRSEGASEQQRWEAREWLSWEADHITAVAKVRHSARFRASHPEVIAEFKKEVGEFARYLKETPPAEGSSGVLYPGEIEHRREQDRRANGIEVEDTTWYKLRALADGYGLTDQLGFEDEE